MAREILIVDGFERDGGTGRFSAGRLWEYASYWIGTISGVSAINVAIAVYWSGETHAVAEFRTPWFQTVPTGGCDAQAGDACGDPIQVSLGTLYITLDGGLRFAGNSYFGQYSGLPFGVSSDSGKPKCIAGAWNYIELKLVLAGFIAKTPGTSACDLDADPDPYGLITARVNGTECLRVTAATGPYTYAVYAPCGCFICAPYPVGIGEIRLRGDVYGTESHLDDFVLASWDMEGAEDPWIGDGRTLVLPAAGAGSSAQWTPVGAATNWQAVAADDGATSYARTNLTGKRDALALAASADTTAVLAAQPQIVARAIYKAGGGPPVKAFYRRGGVDYATGTLTPQTTFSAATEDASVPTVGETAATLSAGEIGYTTE